MNKYDIVLAGLLHDIGKFFEKANSKGQVVSGIEVSTEYHGITSYTFIKYFGDKLTKGGFYFETNVEMAQRQFENNGCGHDSVEDAPV